MRFAGHSLLSAQTPAVLILPLLLANAAPALTACPVQDQAAKVRSLAANQHEIVMLLIQKKQFDEAATEAGKIFDLNWPANEEPLLLTELQILSKKFKDAGQPAIALRLLDTNMKAFKMTSSEIWIWKEKGYLYKSMNQNEEALKCFQRAQRLETGK